MKQTLFLILIIIFSNFSLAQDSNYEILWSKVKQLEIDGLPKSALKIVEDIAQLAKKDNNTPQHIKTMLFKSKFALILEEDAQLNIINDFKKEIKQSTFPAKHILESLLANLYWQYFNQNRWQFYNRTQTSKKVNAEDFRTWDLQTLFNEIHIHYQNSLKNGLMLQLEPLNNYDALLNIKKDSKIYRPTLLDFLSHQALDFYKTDETHITKPAYKFEIDKPEFLEVAKIFSTQNVVSKDSTSLQLNAIKIYKNLIQFHLRDTTPFALADVNINRLKFVKQHATFSNKESVLLDALKLESEKLKTHETSGLYDFEIASILYQQSKAYQNNVDDTHRWKAKEALEICNAVIAKFPESKAAEKCKVLKSKIKQQSFQITTENFLPIQQHALLLLRYTNIDSLKFSIFKLKRNQFKKFNKIYKQDEQLQFIKKLSPEKNWEARLKNENDYQSHTTEILVPKLNNGYYLIFAANKNNKDSFAFSTVQVTNLAVVETDSEDYKTFQIINRINGKPIPLSDVELSFQKSYNNSIITDNYFTNTLGEIKIKKSSNPYRSLTIKVNYNNDLAYLGEYYINQYRQKKDNKTKYKGFIFTDRSIYRPGQTVYFKGIAIETNDDKSSVLAETKLEVTLKDANQQEIKTINFITNEFGSFSGEFILPDNGLNGNYSLNISSKKAWLDGHVNISVEEYKRPKFETTFLPVTETYKINDSVTVKGQALAYTGSTITNAKVVYRVHRKVEYPRWYYWYRPYVNSESQEITHGESITNKKGEFKITFKAQPDQSIDKNNSPIFKYEITADVTDLNGETRSATTVVNVGYHALVANMTVEPALDKTKTNHSIYIDIRNLNGVFTAAKGTIKIYKLKAPNSVLRPRPWAAPDYQTYSKKTFKDLFPHEAYKNEHESSNWNKGPLALKKTFNTKISDTLVLDKLKKWESGQYLITLETQDKFGQAVKDEIRTSLFSNNDNTIADKQCFSISTNKTDYDTGEIAAVTLASAANNLNVTIKIEKHGKIIKTQVIQLNNNKKTIFIPIKNDDVGGLVVRYSYALFNSFKTGTLVIPVPYPNNKLEIETITFRDKLQPGTNETWCFKIKGPQGEKVSAELLASMYDASLDKFKSHFWDFNPTKKSTYYSQNYSRAYQSFGIQNFRVYNSIPNLNYPIQNYDALNWFGFNFRDNRNIRIRGASSLSKTISGKLAGVQISADDMEIEESISFSKVSEARLPETPITTNKESKIQNDLLNHKNEEKSTLNNIQIRKNLQETAFFFPQLQTDADGNVSFSFTTPEALTQWKLQLLTHTKTLESATKTLKTVTQKELMVIPNAPRFLRAGDTITLSTKIANLSDNKLSGEAFLLLTDAITGKKIDAQLGNSENKKAFTVDAKENTQVSWSLSIPNTIQAVQYKILAKSKTFSDGEQNALPVLSNRMLVTETLPMWIKSNETRTFTFNKLKTNTSATLKHHKLTLEITSNPAWYAVQALPYLMEYPYECNEQTFSRYYANALGSHIANSNPRIQEVFNQWKSQDVLESNLEKNQELKSILIQETPWLRDAKSETQQKKRVALLFDLNKMKNELNSGIQKLIKNQMPSGAWAWFLGGRENRYITQHIITGFGHLKQLGVETIEAPKMIEKAITYLDTEFVKEYKKIKKYNANADLNKDHLSHTQLHYLYMRSFYPNIKKSREVEDIDSYYQTQIKKYWLKRSLYAKGLMALICYRNKDEKTAHKILNSLKENSITHKELGMYWKENTNSWHWYQAPIETQALLIEAFSEIENNTKTIDQLKIWLLKNKQTNKWKTTKATTEAVYALLLQGSDWLSVSDKVNVVLGGQPIDPYKLENVTVEAGTGYYNTSWNASEIKPKMGEVKLTKKGDGIAWGSLYWQYFENLDKITSTETPLKLNKKLFLKQNTDTGEVLTEITKTTPLKVGDLIRVRIELRSDRTMEFVHMKDMRAAGLEPVNVLSQYKWQDGLGYYESTKDASTNFFFDYLTKGNYVFEYDLRINNAGKMSNGIATIQSMYAPEFSSHSEGQRIEIE